MSTELEIVWRVLLAAALGGAVGFDRELRNRPAGLRTHMLVAMGSALFVGAALLLIEQEGGTTGARSDLVRMGAGVAMGIGFLGAGAILQASGRVWGLTTAAGIWVTAAIGVAVGSGFIIIGIATTLAAVVVIALLTYLEPKTKGRQNSSG